MCKIEQLFENNQKWAESKCQQDGEFFQNLAKGQQPDYLWIDCSDARVPANKVVGLELGELFVHRNIANSVQSSNINCQSVLKYSIDVLKVKHIIVCGRYSCGGGVQASMGNDDLGIIDNWIQPIKQTYVDNLVEIEALRDSEKLNRMCELNVMAQVENLAHNKIVQQAWQRGQELQIHGWILAPENGKIFNLEVSKKGIESVEAMRQFYRMAS